MQTSGNNAAIKACVESHDKVAKVKKGCGRPFNRLRRWDEDKKLLAKETKRKNWCQRGVSNVLLFVPPWMRIKDFSRSIARRSMTAVVSRSQVDRFNGKAARWLKSRAMSEHRQQMRGGHRNCLSWYME